MREQFLKTFRGDAHQKLIQTLLYNLKDRGYFKDFTFFSKSDRRGYPGFKNQFYFPFLIEFHDNEKWIIQSTTTFPRERMNGYQWNSLHFKRIDTSITKTFVIYPDSMEEGDIRKCVNAHNDIVENKIVSAIDGVVSFAELYMLIEEKWLKESSGGRRSAVQGTAFEKWLVDILNHSSNKEIWNRTGDKNLGFNYPFFEKVLNKFGITEDEIIKKIDATDAIPPLPNGGSPKTDVVVTIEIENERKQFSISSKRTRRDWVSIHQYGVEDYIKVLNIVEEELKDALRELQETGAPTQISEYHREVIASILPKYHRDLANWAYAGIGGLGNEIQKAEYFTVYKNDTKELTVYKREEYIEKILKDVENGQFDSPFVFTYQGKRGTNIQLKGKVI